MTDDGSPKPVGKILKGLPVAKAVRTRIRERIIDAAVLLDSPNDPLSVLYQHSVLCQTCLPFRDPEKGDFVPVGLPFGPKARLVLMHINQQALLSQSPCIEIEDSLTRFVRRMLKLDTGGRTVRVVKDQLARLSAASIRLGLVKEGRATTVTSQIVTAFDIWFPKDERQRVLWPSTVQLSLDYWESLKTHAVPLDETAVGALSHSALGLDVYAWLAQRLHRVPEGATALLVWPVVYGQFGLGYTRLEDFRKAFKVALKQVAAVYPRARIDLDRRGMTLRNSPPPVPYQALRVVHKPV
jgi:hypothetical protein